ncbi:hypothetical protein OEA41_007174 [Lepraria neglecta]|uniref:SET domain-containing protein n=1 Tax=Lepraria neglecta TaxID=209136 RepID=A0AAD9ZCB9_9LECA|nr:hypothetical protein OEA41_007174 [Lepraria neglecta]
MANNSDQLMSKSIVIANSPGKGKGIFAVQNITKGECLIREKPIMGGSGQDGQLLAKLTAQLHALPTQQQRGLLELHWPLRPQYPLRSRFYANAFDVTNKSDTVSEGGICLNAARFNHACIPTAYWVWNCHIERLTLHAITDIPKGGEIFVSHAPFDSPPEERIDTLNNIYGFTCSCFEREVRRLEADRLHTRMEELGFKEGRRDKDKARTMATPGSDEDPLPTILKLIEVCKNAGFPTLALATLHGQASSCYFWRGDSGRERECKAKQREVATWCIGKEASERIIKDVEQLVTLLVEIPNVN